MPLTVFHREALWPPRSSSGTLLLPSLAQTWPLGLVAHTLWPLPAFGQHWYHVDSVSLAQVPLRGVEIRELRSGSACRMGGDLFGERGWYYCCWATVTPALALGALLP